MSRTNHSRHHVSNRHSKERSSSHRHNSLDEKQKIREVESSSRVADRVKGLDKSSYGEERETARLDGKKPALKPRFQ